ncbi:hypothetical protein K1719_029434 [Acacia pycnantha]|nr:hypothetical protein K1719_029434 [Acacia pycnantha]
MRTAAEASPPTATAEALSPSPVILTQDDLKKIDAYKAVKYVESGMVLGLGTSFRKRVRSKEGGSDDSDEDYVVPDEVRELSDCSEDSLFSLDGCESKESFDSFVEDEDEEEIEVIDPRQKMAFVDLIARLR